MVRVLMIQLETFAQKVFLHFEVLIAYLRGIVTVHCIQVKQEVVRLDIPMDVTQRVKLFDHFQHLNTELEYVNFFEIFLILVEYFVYAFA